MEGKKTEGWIQNTEREMKEKGTENTKKSVSFSVPFFVARGALYTILSLSPVACSAVALPALCAGKNNRAQMVVQKYAGIATGDTRIAGAATAVRIQFYLERCVSVYVC